MLEISRVQRMKTRFEMVQAIYFEAKGKFKEANDVLGKLLEDHPDSHFALKRQVGTPSPITRQPSTFCMAVPCHQ